MAVCVTSGTVFLEAVQVETLICNVSCLASYTVPKILCFSCSSY